MQLTVRVVRVLSFVVLLSSCTTFEPAPEGGDGGASSGSSGTSGSSGGSSGGGPTPVANGETIAAGLNHPRSLQATSAGPYWISITADGASSSIERLHHCPPNGCNGAPALLLHDDIRSLAASDSEIFWTTDAGIYACAVGATCTQQEVHPAAVSVALVVSDGKLAFATASGNEVALQRCDRAACSASLTKVWSGNGIGVIASSGDELWFTTGQPSVLLQRSVGGAAPAPIGTLRGLPTSMAAMGAHVHYVSQNALDYCNAATSCSPVTVDPAAENIIWAVRRTGGAIYYAYQAAGGTPGKIMRCTSEDCRERQVVIDGGNPRDVAVYDGWLYWADLGNERAGNATIKRVKL